MQAESASRRSARTSEPLGAGAEKPTTRGYNGAPCSTLQLSMSEPMSNRRNCWPAAALTLLLSSVTLSAAEPWADAKLTVREGLTLWLDASKATGDKPPPSDGVLETWLDASGKARHVIQSTADKRPKLLKVGPAAVVRFDGIDDHLRAVKQASELDSLTIFLVAAPRQNVGAFRGLLAFNKAGEKDYTSGLTIDLGPYATPQFSALNVEGRGFGGAAEPAQRGHAVRPTLHDRSLVRRCCQDDQAGRRWAGRRGAAARRLAAEHGRDHRRSSLLQQRRRAAAGRGLHPGRHRRTARL